MPGHSGAGRPDLWPEGSDCELEGSPASTAHLHPYTHHHSTDSALCLQSGLGERMAWGRSRPEVTSAENLGSACGYHHLILEKGRIALRGGYCRRRARARSSKEWGPREGLSNQGLCQEVLSTTSNRLQGSSFPALLSVTVWGYFRSSLWHVENQLFFQKLKISLKVFRTFETYLTFCIDSTKWRYFHTSQPTDVNGLVSDFTQNMLISFHLLSEWNAKWLPCF